MVARQLTSSFRVRKRSSSVLPGDEPQRITKRRRVLEQESGTSTWQVSESSTELLSTDGEERRRSIGSSRKTAVVFPALEIKPSNIPFGGLGVFAKERIVKNAWLTEYGGEIIDVEEAKRRRQAGEDTHIRSAGFQDFCIDSRVRNQWTMTYYTKNHMVGGFFNDAKNSIHANNCRYETKDCGYLPPYCGGRWVSKRVFLRASRDIAAGEELFVCYGPTYHTIHL